MVGADADDADASIDSLETLAGANETAISNMLSGSSLDLDTFSEIVSFVESVDTVNDGLVSDLTSVTGASIDSLETAVSGLSGGSEASIDSLETYADAISSDLAAEILATNGDVTALGLSVDSLETQVSGVASDLSDYEGDTDTSIDSLETQVSGVASDLSDYEGDTDTSIDSLETALTSEISTTDGEITAINASINSLELYDSVFEQGAVVAASTQFTLNTAVKFGANDDLLVFINGHNIHKDGTFEGQAEGYTTADGATFDLVSIGYDIDATDHVTVIGIRQ